MSTALVVIAVILGVVGIAGAILPALPGPPLSWLGMLLMYFFGGTNADGERMSLTLLLIWLGVTIVVTVIDYLVPAWFTKMTGGSKWAGRGALAGLLIGMFIPPVGIILGSLIGAFAAELLFANKGAADSVQSSLGALLGFLCGTGLKLIASGMMMYYIIVYI